MPRQTNEARSAATRAQLLDATIDCLIELGYSKTSTTEIARRAGVSRGAQLHHYPTKTELVLAAVEHLFARRKEEFRAAVRSLPRDADRGAQAIDLLWPVLTGPSFAAWLELVVAARTDELLREQVRTLALRLDREIEAVFVELFDPPESTRSQLLLGASLIFATIEGLAVERMIMRESDQPFSALVELLKQLVATMLAGLHPRNVSEDPSP